MSETKQGPGKSRPEAMKNRLLDLPERVGTWSLAFALAMVGAVLSAGCNDAAHSSTGTPAGSSLEAPRAESARRDGSSEKTANPLDATNTLRSFVARGVIREISADRQSVVVRHEEVPGVMPKMTMTFAARGSNELEGLRAGDAVTFRVRATEEESWIEDIRRVDPKEAQELLAAADPPSASLLRAGEMKTGEVLPDTELLAEDGRTIRLSEFEGRALAFTFLFTRCPLPDFCPRMNQHFQRARQLLLNQPAGPTNWQFLSISFDPEFDKPGVLTRYAYSYRGRSRDRWLFAAAPAPTMAVMASRLDFRFANEGGSFVHNLRTVVLDSHRRIYRQFDGNKWTPEELAAAIAEAAAVKPRER